MRETPQKSQQVPEPPQGPIENWTDLEVLEWNDQLNNLILKIKTDLPPYKIKDDVTYREIFEKQGKGDDDYVKRGFSARRVNETQAQFFEAIHRAILAEGIDLETVKKLQKHFFKYRKSRDMAALYVLLLPAVRRLLQEGYTLRDLAV